VLTSQEPADRADIVSMKVVAWNMNWKSADRNWNAFRDGGDLSCDVALLNEATAPPDDLGLEVVTEGVTVGLDDVVHEGLKTRRWATAVASPHRLENPPDVWALPPKYKDRRSKLKVSRPGAWTAALVKRERRQRITVISLYGLLDERSDASVHRSLSDLTPLFEDERYNEWLLLGGDLNTLCTAPAGSMRLARDQSVLDRITKGFGLVDLLQESLRRHHPDRGRLAGCKCSLRGECQHTWTFRRRKTSTVPYQDDYLFASPRLAERLERCDALPFTPTSTSDHAPIVATFNI
jgi:hypothetical protein